MDVFMYIYVVDPDSDIALYFSILQLTWLNSHLRKIWPYVDEVNFLILAFQW